MRKTKIILSLLLTLSLFLLPVSVGADYVGADTKEADTEASSPSAETEVTEGSPDSTDTDTDGTEGVSGNRETGGEASENSTPDGSVADGTAGADDKVETGSEGDEVTAENPFEVALAEIGKYATEIICSLSLIASLILAYAYKKGLLPIINGALTAITKTVSGVKSHAEAGEKELSEGLERLAELASSQEERLAAWDDTLKDACAALAEVTEECKCTAKMKDILLEEVELLYDIFMSSSLPQYKKDAVAERIANMKKETVCDDAE